jgi:ABC-type sugar transport system substrate-binding protein
LAQNTLTANPDLNAIFVAFDPGAAAAAAAVDQKGLTGKVLVVGFDALPVMLERIKAGTAAATVRQDPATMGKEGINLALKVINGESVEPKTLIPGEVITKDNVDKYLAPAQSSAPKKDPKDIKIAFSGFSGTNEFWLTLARAAEAQAKDQGVQFINLTTETQDAEAQKRAVDNAITQGVDAIIIGAADSRGWDDTLAKAKAAGIAAIAVDTAIENPVISSLIQTDNEAAAGLAGDWLCQQLGGKGKALVLGGTVGHQTGDARKNGVENKLKACGVEVIADYSNWDENVSSQLAQNTLTANPDLNAIFVAFDPGAAAAAAAVRLRPAAPATTTARATTCARAARACLDPTCPAGSARRARRAPTARRVSAVAMAAEISSASTAAIRRTPTRARMASRASSAVAAACAGRTPPTARRPVAAAPAAATRRVCCSSASASCSRRRGVSRVARADSSAGSGTPRRDTGPDRAAPRA